MTNTLRTGLYYLKDPDMDWGAAHLYEHLLIRSFGEQLKAKGYSPYLYGWLSGETFQDVMFLDYGFYNQAVEELFIAFMRQGPRINLRDIENELLRVQAEDTMLATIANPEELQHCLLKIDQTEFVAAGESHDVEQVKETPESNGLIKEKYSKKSFRRITITVSLPHATLEEKAIFLRLTPIVFDAINSELFTKGLYRNEASWPLRNRRHDFMVVHEIYTVRKGAITNEAIEKAARDAVAGIDLTGHEKELALYVNGFVATPNWATFPIDYFRYTDLLVSKKRIAELFTPAAVQEVTRKLEMHVTRTLPEHYRGKK